MNPGDVMSEIATQLRTIDGLQVIAQRSMKIVPPSATVSFPESYRYNIDTSGGHEIVLRVLLLVGRVWDEQTRDRMTRYADPDDNDYSIKKTIESGVYTSFGECAVTEGEFGQLTIAGVTYDAAEFTVSITS